MDPENTTIPPNDERLDKIQSIMELADQGYVKEEEFIEIFNAIKEAMNVIKTEAANDLDLNVTYLDDRINTVRNTIAEMQANGATKDELTQLRAEVFALGLDMEIMVSERFADLEIPDISPLLTKAEYQADRANIIKEATQKIPYENPEEIRDALESLEDDERLDISAIRGFDEFKKSIEKKIKNKETVYFGGGSSDGTGGISDIGGLIEEGAGINITGTGTEEDPYIIAADFTGYATESYVNTTVANLVDSSPATLDTLNELAAALGDDPNFATTVATALGTKAADTAVVHNTGNETIAGQKTFSSDVLVPDEAYGVGWNGSLEAPTKNALYDKIESLTVGAGVDWGDITGTLSDQTDLQSALDAKADALGADDNYVTDAEKVKLSNLSGTNTGDQDLTPYFNKSVDDTDDITQGTNKFATAAEKTKLGHISVTQAVDLDTMETQAAAGAAAKVKTDFITVTQAVDLDDIETRVNNLDAAVVLKGTWDASAGTFPGGGTAQAGASYIVSVAGTVNSVAFAVGDRIIAITDNASTTTYAANWFKADYTDQVLSVNGQTGAVSLAKGDVGLGNVDNTSDATKLSAAGTLSNKNIDLASNTVTGTKAQFDSALSDGNFLYSGDITQYTDELAQDAIGGILTDSSTIDFTYDDGAGSITAIVKDNSVSYAKMQDVSATSRVLGRKTAGAGDTEELTLSELLDFIGSAAQGDILYRGNSGWARLAAGTAGQYLKTGGSGANPSWADAPTTSTNTATAGEAFTGATAPQAAFVGNDAMFTQFTGDTSGTSQIMVEFGYDSASGGVRCAQKITTASSGIMSVKSVVASLGHYIAGGSTADIYATVEADSAGAPSGTPLGTSNTNLNVTGAQADYTFTFSSAVALSPSTTYWIVLYASDPTGTAAAVYGQTSGGSSTFSVYYSGSWHLDTNKKMRIMVYGSVPAGRIYKTDTATPHACYIDGIVTNTVAAGSTATAFTPITGGAIIGGFSGLTLGARYYAGAGGAISTTASPIYVGVALSTSTILCEVTGVYTAGLNADATANATANMVKITGLDVSLPPGMFQFTYYIRYTSGTSTTGVKFAVDTGAGTATAFVSQMRQLTTGTTQTTNAPTQNSPTGAVLMEGFTARAKNTTMGPTTSVDSGGGDMMCVIEGLVVLSAGGVLSLYHGSETTTSTQVKAGSLVRVTNVN